MIDARRIVPLLIAPLLFAIASCGLPSLATGTDEDPQPSRYSRGELCTQFADFLRDKLSLDATYTASEKSEFDRPVEWIAICTPWTANATAGNLLVRNPRLKGTVEPTGADFKIQGGFDEKVWATSDNRFRVQIGSWVTEMAIVIPAGDKFRMTDEQAHETVDFLIRLTREVNQG